MLIFYTCVTFTVNRNSYHRTTGFVSRYPVN